MVGLSCFATSNAAFAIGAQRLARFLDHWSDEPMRKRLLLFCIASGSASSVLLAAEAVPRYDVERLCRWQQEVHWRSGARREYDADEYRRCFSSNQRAYDAVRGKWASTTQEMRAFCLRIAAHNGPPSYYLLDACIDNELSKSAARQKLPAIPFKY